MDLAAVREAELAGVHRGMGAERSPGDPQITRQSGERGGVLEQPGIDHPSECDGPTTDDPIVMVTIVAVPGHQVAENAAKRLGQGGTTGLIGRGHSLVDRAPILKCLGQVWKTNCATDNSSELMAARKLQDKQGRVHDSNLGNRGVPTSAALLLRVVKERFGRCWRPKVE